MSGFTPKNDYQGFSAAAVTPSNTVDISPKPVKLFIGTGGHVKVDMANTGTAIIFKNVPSGSFLPILVTRVYAADTDATDIVALW